jgi:hypothetical protein
MAAIVAKIDFKPFCHALQFGGFEPKLANVSSERIRKITRIFDISICTNLIFSEKFARTVSNYPRTFTQYTGFLTARYFSTLSLPNTEKGDSLLQRRRP